MNLFAGLTDRGILSFWLMFLLFNLFVVLMAVALAAFYVASRPRRGRVRTAALWHLVAVVWFMLSLISTVWAAPAEKAFIDPTDHEALFRGERFPKVVVGLVFALIGILCMVAGAIVSGRQKRAAAQQALLEA